MKDQGFFQGFKRCFEALFNDTFPDMKFMPGDPIPCGLAWLRSKGFDLKGCASPSVSLAGIGLPEGPVLAAVRDTSLPPYNIRAVLVDKEGKIILNGIDSDVIVYFYLIGEYAIQRA